MVQNIWYENNYYKIKYPSNMEKKINVGGVGIGIEEVSFKSNNNNLIEISVEIINNFFNKKEFEDLIKEHIEENKESIIESELIDIEKGSVYKIIFKTSTNNIFTFIFHRNNIVFILSIETVKIHSKEITMNIYSIFHSFKIKETTRILSNLKREWNIYKLPPFEIYYPNNSEIYDYIKEWAEKKINAFKYITKYLGVKWDDEIIKIYVFNDNFHGKFLGFNLGFSILNRYEIFTTINQSDGHELTHIISYKMANGKCIYSKLINEGLATYLDLCSSHFHERSKNILKKDNCIKLLENEFESKKDNYTLSASFVKYLIENYGLILFKDFFCQNHLNEKMSFIKYYNKKGTELIEDWFNYIMK